MSYQAESGKDEPLFDNIEQGLADQHAAPSDFERAAAPALETVGGILPALFAASMVVLIQSALNCRSCGGQLAYAIAVGVISAVATAAMLYLERAGSVPEKLRLYFAVFMFIWWTVGAGVITYNVFSVTTNAYFGAWVAWLCSLALAQKQLEQVASLVHFFEGLGRTVSVLLICSLIEMFSGVAVCEDGCDDYDAYALACGVVSTILVLALIFVPAVADQTRNVAFFLVVWWIAGASINTFKGSFQATSNGFFSSWACLVASCYLLKNSPP